MIPICIKALIIGQFGPVWLVGGSAVDKCLDGASSRKGLLSLSDQLVHLKLYWGSLVHGWAALKPVQKLKHLTVNIVDFSFHPLALSGNIEEEWDVVFSSDHQRAPLQGVSIC